MHNDVLCEYIILLLYERDNTGLKQTLATHETVTL